MVYILICTPSQIRGRIVWKIGNKPYRWRNLNFGIQRKHLLTLSLFLIIYVSFIVFSADTYLETGFVLFDVFFLLITGIAATWAKPKEFQLQKMKGISTVNPYFVMLNQLPIPKEILIKNRFVIYYAYAVPFHTLFLILNLRIFGNDASGVDSFPIYCFFAYLDFIRHLLGLHLSCYGCRRCLKLQYV